MVEGEDKSGSREIYGTVVSNAEGPCTRKFSFVIKKGKIVKRGQFVEVPVNGGRLIGRVSDVFNTNRYFSRPESVEKYESSRPMKEIFPVKDWEYLVADVTPLGVRNEESMFEEVTFPPSPGAEVCEPDHSVLSGFLGLDKSGLRIGEIPHHKVGVSLNLTRLLQKHLAILAISGAGKSYLVSVLIEEILARESGKGQVAGVIVDTHGEYLSFAEDPGYASKINVFQGKDVKIGLPDMSPREMSHFLPKLSGVQVRELARVMKALRDEGARFGMKDLIKAVEEDEKMKSSTKDVVVSVLYDLMGTGIFGAKSYPSESALAEQGKISIVDLSMLISARSKQIIVSHLSRGLFNGRRRGEIPPFLLVLEEAHQFVPEKMKSENAISRGIIQTIAREGRKFHASLCLISQRPIQLSTTVLSQCNTQIILRITNPYDLDHIGKSAEGITKDVQNQLSGLRVGTGLVIGEAVNFPLFVKIRQRKSRDSRTGISLEEAAKEFSEKKEKQKTDAKSFM